MDAFAGANTVVRGNCTFGMFSNYPENVDDALRQRAGGAVPGRRAADARGLHRHPRAAAGRATTRSRWATTTFMPRRRSSAPSPPAIEGHARPQEDGLLRGLGAGRAPRIGPLDTLAKLGTYLKAIQEADAALHRPRDQEHHRRGEGAGDGFRTAGRMDGEAGPVPASRTTTTKKAMIADLRRPITVEMVVQEINRYADSEFRYADKLGRGGDRGAWCARWA